MIERGGLNQVGDWLRTLWGVKKVAIISDNRVAKLYASIVEKSLEKAGFQVVRFEFLQGEASKNLTTVSKVYEFLATQGMTRSDGIVALGGGVVGDLAGFAASTYMRGISFVQIPTSLTAQVDSSIGGKTGVNTAFAKNMVGTFAQPDGVFIDPEVLSTLGHRELIEGMGEVIKYGLIQDTELWEELEAMDGSVESILEHAESIISHSCLVKRDHVVADELDNGIRLYLNFGHTIGHAIEATAGYGQVMHGEAVSMGMVQLSRVAEEKGLMPKGITQKIEEMCRKFGLPVTYENWDKEALYQALTHASGFYRDAFKNYKGMFDRIFMTGVSPVTLDDLTSGFNIGWNISTNPLFNGMLGFSEEDVRTMMRYYQEAGQLEGDVEAMIQEMKP